MQYEDRVTIATPEGVDLELTLAGLGSRFFATLIDTGLQFALILALGIAAAVLAGSGDSSAGFLAVALITLVVFFVLVGYHVLFETLASGRTPGKRWTGLRVVRVGGRPVGFLSSMVRNLLRIIDFLPGSYLVGLISVLATKNNQRLGDLAGGTLVVREWTGDRVRSSRRARRTARASRSYDVPTVSEPPTDLDTWDVSSVTAAEVATVRRFLARRGSLVSDARGRLAWELAERLRPKVVGAPDDIDPEPFLEAIVTAKSNRR